MGQEFRYFIFVAACVWAERGVRILVLFENVVFTP